MPQGKQIRCLSIDVESDMQVTFMPQCFFRCVFFLAGSGYYWLAGILPSELPH